MCSFLFIFRVLLIDRIVCLILAKVIPEKCGTWVKEVSRKPTNKGVSRSRSSILEVV
jgi:hypothetical protein